MNKLTALYGVMKHLRDMKSEKRFSGKMDAQLLLGEEEIGTASGHMDCTEESCSHTFEMNLFGEEVKFEHKGTANPHCCGARNIHIHGHEGMTGHTLKGRTLRGRKYTKAMMMLKLLDRLEYQVSEEGKGILSLELTMADLPEEMREACCCGLQMHPAMSSYFKKGSLANVDLQSMEPESLSIKLLVDEEARPQKISMVHVISAKQYNGEAQDLQFKFSGVVL